jgi:hypothetical protein
MRLWNNFYISESRIIEFATVAGMGGEETASEAIKLKRFCIGCIMGR